MHSHAAPLVAFTRGPTVESVHYGSIAVADGEGRTVASVGDPERVTFMRSSAKPFQAMAVVETGAAHRFEITSAELAVIAASHSGEPRHTEAVRALLQRVGLPVDALQCGLHPPVHAATRLALERRGEAPTPLHHNCSGKHCGMLCACVHRGWDLRTYLRPDHPVQRAVLALLSDVTGLPDADISLAIDGCGVPTFALPLRSFAAAFARLGRLAENEEHGEAAGRVRAAMVEHPRMVAGEGRFDTELMAVTHGRLVAKAGAEACEGVGIVGEGWGLAVKIEDGNSRAVPVAVMEALRQLGALSEVDFDALAHHGRPALTNYRDEVVGEARPVFQLSRSL